MLGDTKAVLGYRLHRRHVRACDELVRRLLVCIRPLVDRRLARSVKVHLLIRAYEAYRTDFLAVYVKG